MRAGLARNILENRRRIVDRKVASGSYLVGILTLAFCAGLASPIRARAQEGAPANTASSPSGAASCTFDAKLFCDKLIMQDEFAIEGGEHFRTSRCRESTGNTSAAMIILKDQDKDVIKVRCELHCGNSKATNTISAAKLMEQPAWGPAADAFVKKYDACSPSDAAYGKLVEAYQKQTGFDYTPN
jgi:hypothetical protein